MKNISQENFNAAEISERYKECKYNYENLGINLVQALKLFLDENDIKVLSIDYRVKDDSSFAEKIDRKHYANPFDEIEDICGIRIICYYQSDVDKISEVLREEFTVIENQDKEALLKADQFGYRSTHFIVKIKNEWNKAPNYRGLENLKAEIQIRTVLMHAWAEIEHKLVYKNANQIPTEYREEFAEISALLKISDKKFEKLRENITSYKEEVTEKFEKDEYEGVELNVDSLQAFLDKYFPDKLKAITFTTFLVDDLDLYSISLNDFFIYYKKVENYLSKIEGDVFEYTGLTESQFGTAMLIVKLNNILCFPNAFSSSKTKLIREWQEIITADEAAKNKITK